jgi:hypothetical protein
MYLCLYGEGRNDFDAGKSIARVIEMGWVLKVETFLGAELAMSVASAIGHEKVEI